MNLLFLAEVSCWDGSFVGFGHNKRMAKNIAAKDALDSKSLFFLRLLNIDQRNAELRRT